MRASAEPVDDALHGFYDRLLTVLRDPVARDGQWRLLECVPAWDGNGTWDGFIAWAWETPDGQRRAIAVNYAANQGQCYVRLPFSDLAGHFIRLVDLMGPAQYDRDGSDLGSRGLYLDIPPWS